MRFFMSIQTRFDCKRFATNWTNVRSFTAMGFAVELQFVFGEETLTAVFTTKGPFTRMSPFMSLETCFVPITFRTFRAIVWLFIGVDPSMPFEHTLFYEAHSTLVAFVTFFLATVLNYPVSSQLANSIKCFFALLTLVIGPAVFIASC